MCIRDRSGTELGIGLAIMRLASLGGLPITALADRFGRRMMLLVTVGAGLALTVVAAASPTYWWFVAIFACGRPLLSASNGLAQVTAAEQTASADRAKACLLYTSRPPRTSRRRHVRSPRSGRG